MRNGDHTESALIPQRRSPVVGVTLACGCTVTMRNAPMNKRARFVCTMGQGHGYRLAWTSYKDTNNLVTRNSIEEE